MVGIGVNIVYNYLSFVTGGISPTRTRYAPVWCLQKVYIVGYFNIVSLMSQCPTVAVHGAQCMQFFLFMFSICLAALPCKRAKLTSGSDNESQSLLGPKGVTGQAAETHIQSPVTRESSEPKQKKVLEESDTIKAKDVGPRKRELLVSAKVNKHAATILTR